MLTLTEKVFLAYRPLRTKPWKRHQHNPNELFVGFERNIQAVGLSQEEAFFLLQNDIEKEKKRLKENFAWFGFLDEPRQAAVVFLSLDMESRLDKLKGFSEALEIGDYPKASKALLGSYYHLKNGTKAEELAKIILTGIFQQPKGGLGW